MRLILIILNLIILSGCASTAKTAFDSVYVVEREREALFVSTPKGQKEINGLGNLNHATMKFHGDFGYVLGRDGYISKIDIINNVLIKKVKIGKSGIGITFIKNYIAIVNYAPNSVVLLDADLNIVHSVETGSRNVGIKAYKNLLTFSLMDKNEIWIMNVESFEIIKKFENVGKLPFDALVNQNKYIVGFFNEPGIGILDLDEMKYEKVMVKDSQDNVVMKVPHFGYWGIINNKAIVPLVASNKLLVLDLKTNKAIKEIEVIGTPVFAAVSPDKKSLMVNYSGEKEDFISIIDVKNQSVLKDIEIGRRVMHLRFAQDGKKAYVTSYFDNALKILDTKNWNVVEEKKVPTPSGIFIKENRGESNE